MSSKSVNKKLVIGVTVGASAYSLLRGQLAWYQERGWEVHLISTPDEKAKLAAAREGVKLSGIPMERDIVLRRDLRALVHWLKTLRRLNPQIVNIGTPKASLLGMISATILRVPKRLYLVRGLRLEGTAGIKAAILWLAEVTTMSLATDVIFVSDSLAEEAQRRKLFFSHKSWVIAQGSSNGVDSRAISSRISQVNAKELRSAVGVTPKDLVVGFVGRLAQDKGIDILLSAFEHPDLKENIRGLFIGELEDPDIKDRLEALQRKVKFLEWKEDVWGYFPAVDVLCLPTKREGFPNVVLEAAAAGIPAVTTYATGAVDSVVSGETGELVQYADVNKLVEILNRYKENPELVITQGKNAKRRAAENFKPEEIWFGFEEIMTSSENPSRARKVDRA